MRALFLSYVHVVTSDQCELYEIRDVKKCTYFKIFSSIEYNFRILCNANAVQFENASGSLYRYSNFSNRIV